MSESFAARLKSLRSARGVSQRWLAREAGISDAFLCQMERGQTEPGAAVLERLADVLGTTMDALWKGAERHEEVCP